MLPGLTTTPKHATRRRDGYCAKCGSRIKIRFPGQQYGPTCMRKLGLAMPAPLSTVQTTTQKPKRLRMPKTKPFTRVAGNKCDRAPSGCANDAELAVGKQGQYRLCTSCACRGEFARHTKRVPLMAVQNV